MDLYMKNQLKKIIAVSSLCVMISSCETINTMRFDNTISAAEKYFERGDYENAIEKYDNAINIDDRLLGCWIGKINSQILNDNLSGAADSIREVLNNNFAYYAHETDDIQDMNKILLDMCEKKWNTAADINEIDSIMAKNGWLDNTGITLNDGTIKVYLDGERLEFENQPFIYEERVLIPVHPLMEKLGWTAKTDKPDNTRVTLYSPPQGEYNHTKNISCTADLNIVGYSDLITANLDGGVHCNVIIDTAPRMNNGELMIPLRITAQIIGRSVVWNENAMSVYIDSQKSDEELVDKYIVEFAGTMGSGQSDNFVYDIDGDKKQELICIGYSRSNECLITVYDRDGNNSFSIHTEFPLIETDNGTHQELLEFIKIVDYYDYMKELQAKQEVEQMQKTIKLEEGAPPQYGMSYSLTKETAIKLIKLRYGIDAELVATGNTMYTFEGGGKTFSVARWYNTDSVDEVEFTVN